MYPLKPSAKIWETAQKITKWKKTETTDAALTAIMTLKIFIVLNQMAIILNPVMNNAKQ